ncbi:Ephrin Type-A Receptor 6 [Manis pentadactyla]|nr:Ephrin Type-A Receptor 6 [Manis pentadactyla]
MLFKPNGFNESCGEQGNSDLKALTGNLGQKQISSTRKMPEFVIRYVLSREYQYDTHLNVIPIKGSSSQEAKERNGPQLIGGADMEPVHRLSPPVSSLKQMLLPDSRDANGLRRKWIIELGSALSMIQIQKAD